MQFRARDSFERLRMSILSNHQWFGRRLWVSFWMLLCSGCVAVEKAEGSNFVYRQSVLIPLLLGLFGLLLAISGAVAAIQAIPFLMPAKPVKKKGKKKKPTVLRGAVQLGFASLATLLGLGLLLLGVPSTLLSTVTVKPDRIVLRTGNMFYSTSSREIPFESIQESQVIEENTLGSKGRRKKKYYWIIAHESGQERIEMNPMHIAAQPKFTEYFSAFRTAQDDDDRTDVVGLSTTTEATVPSTSSTPIVASTTVPTATSNPATEQPSNPPEKNSKAGIPMEPGLAVLPQRGRFRAGKAVGFTHNGQWVEGKVDQVFTKDKVSIRLNSDPTQAILVPMSSALISALGVPAPVLPGEAIKATSEVKIGDTLMAVWGAYWYPVRVESFGQERYLFLSFIGEPNVSRFEAPISQICRLPKNGDLLVKAAMGEPVEVEFPRADGHAEDPMLRANQFKVDQIVMAKFGGDFFPAQVLVIRDTGMIRVHYVDFENSYDADLPADQIREMTPKEDKKFKSKKKIK